MFFLFRAEGLRHCERAEQLRRYGQGYGAGGKGRLDVDAEAGGVAVGKEAEELRSCEE